MINNSWSSARNDQHACYCVGPQRGEPVCPCAMRSVTIENGRYVRKEDLGPVKKSESLNLRLDKGYNKL